MGGLCGDNSIHFKFAEHRFRSCFDEALMPNDLDFFLFDQG